MTEGTAEELAAAEPILEFPVNSAACEPAENAELKPGPQRVRGYALASGEPRRTIDSVQVSADGGHTWSEARITSPVREYCLVLWEAEIRVDDGTDALVVRAVESNGRIQPETSKWNRKGYLFNGWHRVPVRAQ